MRVIYNRDLEGSDRAYRGGCWFSYARYSSAACRIGDAASWRRRILGFRPLIRIRIRIKGLG